MSDIQNQTLAYCKTVTCQVCHKPLPFEVIVFPQEVPKTRVVAIAKALHCGKRYTVRARRTD